MVEKNIFEKKESRADLQYYPKVRELKDAMFIPDLFTQKERDEFADRLDKYIQE